MTGRVRVTDVTPTWLVESTVELVVEVGWVGTVGAVVVRLVGEVGAVPMGAAG